MEPRRAWNNFTLQFQKRKFLRREEILIEPVIDTTGCKKPGEELTKMPEYQPGELYVKQYMRVKYAKPGNSGVVIGQLPSRPLEKAMAGEGLLAQIISASVSIIYRCIGRCSDLKEPVLNWRIHAHRSGKRNLHPDLAVI